jgi:hypothetical protein
VIFVHNAQCRLLAPFDGSPRCNVAVAIGGEPDMQMVVRGDHIGADDPTATLAVHCGNGFDVSAVSTRETDWVG